MNLVRVAWVPRSYDPRIASVRLRCLNIVAALRGRGHAVELFQPARARSYDVVVYSKVYDDDALRMASALKRSGARIVLDLCDNHFYDSSKNAQSEKRVRQLTKMMETADVLVASTDTLKAVMLDYLAAPRPIIVIGDAVEGEITAVRAGGWRRWWDRTTLGRVHRQVDTWTAEGRTPLVWFGSHGGPHAEHGMVDLLHIQGVLEQVCRRGFPLSLTVISNSRKKYRELLRSWSIPTTYLEWSPSTFHEGLALHEIAVVPVTPNPFTLCKSNNRVALPLHFGLAVVADAIPSYEEFRGTVFLDAWEEGLTSYVSNPELRCRHVSAGREMVAANWSLTRITDQWERLLTAQA